MRRNILICSLVFALCLFSLSACGAKEISPEESETIRRLGDIFVDELQKDILPFMDAPENLPELGYVLVSGDVTYGSEALHTAYGQYRMGEDSRVTIVFRNKSYVASHIVFSGGKGYYFRYEYDRFHPDEVSVSGRAIDDMRLEITELPPKIVLKVLKNKREVAGLTLRNPTELLEGSAQ